MANILDIVRGLSQAAANAYDGYENMDEKIADGLITSYRNDLGKISDKIVASSISGEIEIGKENRTASVALYARYLKRIGAHLKNITSSVVNPFESIGYNK